MDFTKTLKCSFLENICEQANKRRISPLYFQKQLHVAGNQFARTQYFRPFKPLPT